MTTAIISKANSDVVDLTIEQHSNSRTELFLEEPLLDGTLDYVVGCSALAIPMSEEPMIPYNLATRELFEIRVRNTGANEGDDTQVPAEYSPTCQFAQDFPIYSVSDFLIWMSNWARSFSDHIAANGLPPNSPDLNNYLAVDGVFPDEIHDLLGIGVTPGGVLMFKAKSGLFWQNFYFNVTPYGQSLLGTLSTVAYTVVGGIWNRNPAVFMTGDPGVIQATATLPGRVDYVFDYSIFRNLEERMYVSLELTEIPLPDHLLIRDGKQSMVHQIAHFPFDTKIRCKVESSGGTLTGETTLTSNVFMNRMHFLSRDEPCYNWYPLTASYFIQNARLQIKITRRKFRSAAPYGWYLTEENVKINEGSVWTASLKFVSIH